MIRLDFQTLAEKVQGKLINEQFGNDRFAGVSIDSRTIVKEQLFVAIAGSNADGHSYIDDALQKGGAGLVIAENYAGLSALPEQVPIVTVDDTHRALITLAAEYRRLVDPECIAVTGSNGKTTTKEMIYAMIRARRKKAYRSEGNLNNLYGLPLTLLAMPPGTAFGIFELGISVPGEMTQLAEIVEPDLALITNVGPTHLEMLDSVGKVAEEKFTLVDRMKSDQPVIINGDDRELIAQADMRDRKFIRYGLGEENDFIASRLGITEDGYSLVSIGGRGVTLKLFGNHQVYNMLGAYTTCQVLGIDLSADELENLTYTLAPYRGEIENVNDLTLIADCYNANPVSMNSGLSSYRRYLDSLKPKSRRNLVVIGDMLELGKDSKEFHRKVGQLVAVLDFDLTLTVGALSKEICRAAIQTGCNKDKIKHFADTGEAGEYLIDNIKRRDIVYFKASRGIGLEKLITLLRGTAFGSN